MLALKIKKDDLLRGVGQTSPIAEKRSAMPILSNVLLEAEADRLVITATDMEISFQGAYPAEVLTPGQLTVPAKKLNEVVRQLNAEEVSLAEEENFTLRLISDTYYALMSGLSPADFPRMPAADDLAFINLDARELAGAIDKTIFSVLQEEARYNLSGIFLEKVEYEGRPSLRLVSTDGLRLNLAGFQAQDLSNLDLPKGVLVSKKGMNELRRLAETTETVRLALSDGGLVARGPNSVLVMRLLDGRFPDYNLVLPKDNNKRLLVGRKELLDALKSVAPMSSNDYKVVKFALEPGRLVISAMTPGLGQAEQSLKVEYEAAPLEIGFNPHFFIEALGALAGEQVRLSFLEAANPALITAPEDPGYSGVIMSMKI